MIAWPENLPPAKIGKSRQQQVGYREAPPRQGPSAAERFTGDLSTTYELSFIYTPGQARTFAAFCEVLRNLPQWFTMPVKTPTGLTTVTCRFTTDGFPQMTGQTNKSFSYSASILIRDQA